MNWAIVLTLFSFGFYFRMSPRDAFAMGSVCTLNLILISFLERRGILLDVATPTFIVAWAVQVYGHRIERTKPSFMKNMAFFLIGPVWVNHAVARAFLQSRRLRTYK